ncbi:4Fe-4S binding protein [bacterium]|nr:4Fe-4S binding protein [bacterium]
MIKQIKIGTGSCGLAAGAGDVLSFFKENMTDDVEIVEVGCLGHCYAEPMIEVVTEGESVFFGHLKPTQKSLDAVMSVDKSQQLVFRTERSDKEQVKVTALAGQINPISLDVYKEYGGYKGLENALKMTPAEVVDEVKKSGLRGRGGGGFPTGLKWSFLASKDHDAKVLICNADEGDPGAFMDRSLMESVPHQVLEGMLVAAWATGAVDIFVYVRAEYPLAITNLAIAIKQAQEAGLDNLNGRRVSLRIKEGAGAFVCGEETALIHSLEGRRGTPRFRPPYPTDSGYKGRPSSINNVETFGNVPLILRDGADEYASVGTEGSKGTKLFALAGDLPNPGLVEVPMGTTIAEIVYEIGGASRDEVKAVQIGGPSGGCIPAKLFDTPVDYDSLKALGAIMGSGGLVVINNTRCMVETARYFLEFTARESCGKCTFCRIGTTRMLETLEKITAGNGSLKDIDFLEDLGPKIIKGSLCGLGQTAPNPVLATLRYYKNEYIDHVEHHKCEALQCDALVDVYIEKDACVECGLCRKACPVAAISPDYVVDNTICTTCNSCIEVCPKNTIMRVPKGGAK